MTNHEHHSHGGNQEHGHGHEHEHGHGHRRRPIHHDWRLWVVVLVMLFAMLAYVMSDNERFDPGNDKQQPMPAAPAL